MKALVQALVSGLLIGGIYALIALGLNIVFGTMRVVNFAQGTLLMAAMFMVYWLRELGGLHPYWSPLITIPLLFVGGYVIQRAFVSPLLARDRAREPMSVLLVTLGLALVLENLALALFSADFKTVQTDLSIATFKVQGLIVSVPRLVGLGHPGVGTSFLLKVFVIVVLGGIGSMPGAAIGGLLVGGIEGVVALYVQAAVAQIVLFAIFVGVLFVRPAGLLGVEQR